MSIKFISAAAIGIVGLAAAAFESAQAGMISLGAATHAAQSHVIQVQTSKRGNAARRSAAPRQASPSRRVAPRRSSSSRKAAPRLATPRKAAPRRDSRRYRWSRDRRHRFYGPYFAVPWGFTLYATHPCYDWRYGSRGWGYYWNYARCPL
jgi:hypothetical protein